MTNKKEILIVEDNIIIAMDIKKIVEELNCKVFITSSYTDTMLHLEKSKPDLILMDIYIKGHKDGIETSYSIKSIYVDMPIIFLTSYMYDELMEKIFDIKPEYYLTKPYNKTNLKASIMFVLLNLKECSFENRISLDENFSFDKSSQNLFYKEVFIHLGEKEKKLLNLLILANEKPIKFEQLEEMIWTDIPASESSLRTLVYRLRTKLNNKFIESVPYYGFKINYNKNGNM